MHFTVNALRSRHMAEILPTRRKTLSTQSINNVSRKTLENGNQTNRIQRAYKM